MQGLQERFQEVAATAGRKRPWKRRPRIKRMETLWLALLLQLLRHAATHAFLVSKRAPLPFHDPSFRTANAGSRRSTLLRSTNDVDKWMNRLQSEQDQQFQDSLEDNFKSGSFETTTVELPDFDFVRRVAVGTYPYAVCGSASETVYVLNLEEEKILDYALAGQDDNDWNLSEKLQIQSTLDLLYGPYDGGGTIAVAMDETNRWICVAGRSGGVQLYSFDAKTNTLEPKVVTTTSGKNHRLLPGILVTCLEIIDKTLWLGTSMGQILAFDLEEDYDEDDDDQEDLEQELLLDNNVDNNNINSSSSVASSSLPYCWCWYDVSEADSPITSLSLNSELRTGVCTTAEGGVYVFPLESEARDISDSPTTNEIVSSDDDEDDESDDDEDGDVPILSVALPEGDNPRIPHSVAIGRYRDGVAVFCGTSDGSLIVQPLNCRSGDDGDDDDSNNFNADFLSCSLDDDVILEKNPIELELHSDTIKCIVANPVPGVLVTGSADGSVCIWNLEAFEDDENDNDENDDETENDGVEGNLEFRRYIKKKDKQEEKELRALYSIEGYKVWLGSLQACDYGKLVSDGSDNSIVVHDFDSFDPATAMGDYVKFLQDEDEETNK